MNTIIFDLDGTLWDSTEQIAISWNQALRDYTNLPADLTGRQIQMECGKPMEDIMESLFPNLSLQEQQNLSQHFFAYENELVSYAPCIFYEHMPETIAELSKKYNLFIVSNCQAGYIEAFLKNSGLGKYFKDHICPGDSGQLKTENIKIIMERNHVEKAVYVGDTAGDEAACNKAGVPFIFASYGFGQAVDPYLTIQSFDDLLSLNI